MFHVIPQIDSRPHEQASTCPCSPEYDPEYDILIHNVFQEAGQKWMVIGPDDKMIYEQQ